MDVTIDEEVKAVYQQIRREDSTLYGIVNSAGIANAPLTSTKKLRSIIELDLEQEVKPVWEVNLVGTIRVNKILFPLLQSKLVSQSREKCIGCIVNISSGFSRITFPSAGPYSMSKFGVSSYSAALRREISHLGIRIVCIEPGFIRTPLAENAVKMEVDPNSIAKDSLVALKEFNPEGVNPDNWQTTDTIANHIFDALFTSNYYPHVVLDKLKMRIQYHLLFLAPHSWVDAILRVKKKN